jgi:hypothetical protein
MQSRAYTEAGAGERRFFYLWGSDARGWRVIRNKVRLDYGRRQCMRGLWREKFDEETFELIGFQLLSAEEMKGDEAIQTLPGSTAAILRKEIEANAGLRGGSHTARLYEDQRLERRRPEDFVERTERKVFVYPFVHADRGDILRAWPRKGE